MATPAARLRTDVALPRPTGGVGPKRLLGSDYRLGFLFVAPMVLLVLAVGMGAAAIASISLVMSLPR